MRKIRESPAESRINKRGSAQGVLVESLINNLANQAYINGAKI